VACESNRVIGYYALASGAITLELAPGRFRRNMPNPIPVVVLARLAVDRAWQSKGIGRSLFSDAARRVANAADVIGIRGIVVHAISEEAKRFYLAHGFEPSPHEPMTLLITLTDLRAALA
jgi:GNAT superfamily N-acetyltransferase